MCVYVELYVCMYAYINVYMSLYVNVCMHVYACLHACVPIPYSHVTVQTFHMSLNKNEPHSHYAEYTCSPNIFTYICQTPPTAIYTSHIIVMYVPETHMPLMLCQICKLIMNITLLFQYKYLI